MGVGIVDIANEPKKHPESKYKTYLYPENGSKNLKSNLSGTAFLDNLEMLSTRKTTNHSFSNQVSLFLLNGTNALNKPFVLFTEES